jgi:hypothetical protein
MHLTSSAAGNRENSESRGRSGGQCAKKAIAAFLSLSESAHLVPSIQSKTSKTLPSTQGHVAGALLQLISVNETCLRCEKPLCSAVTASASSPEAISL